MRTRTSAEGSHSSVGRPVFSTQPARTPTFFSASPFAFNAQQKAEAVEDEGIDSAPVIQAKLTMGAPGDPFEQEADAMADRVVQRMQAGAVRSDTAPAGQATCTGCREEDEKLRRQAEEGEVPEEPLQAKAPGSLDVPGSVQHALEGRAGGGQTLNPTMRDDMESAFGADFSGVHIHTGSVAEHLNRTLSARAFTHGTDIFFNTGEYRPDTREGAQLLAHELTHVVQQSGGASVRGVIQRQDKKKTHVPYEVHVTKPMPQQEFRAKAMHQIFGGVVKNIRWEHSKDSYVPENSPYSVLVDIQLLKGQRGEVSKERGIAVEEGGGVAGAKERARTFRAGPESDQKTALLKAIDDRYFDAVGDKTRTHIKKGEDAKAALWNTIRDEVLFQHEYIANLPPQVKDLIEFSTQGKTLTPADYDKLFAIAKKIEAMPPAQVGDYASKVRGSTTDLDTFEASLDKYIAEVAARDKRSEEREKIHTKLLDLEEIYKKYKLYLTLQKSGGGLAVAGRYPGGGAGGGIVVTREALKLRQEVEAELQKHGFAGITAFEEYIQKFEHAFEAESASIAKDLLAKLAGTLYKESERYKDPGQVSALHQKLGGFRTSYAEFQASAPIWNEYAAAEKKAGEQARIPSQGHLKTSDFTSITRAEAEAAKKKAEAAKASAQTQFQSMAAAHPIFEEEGLPDGKRLNKEALAQASEAQLGPMLQSQIRLRMGDIDDATKEIDDKPELIYKMEKLLPTFYAQQGIRPGSIHDLIIQDKMKSDLILKLVKGIAFAIVAIALAVVSFGTATPAIIAAGAAIAGAGLGVYQAYESYQEYVEEKNLADVGFANDPSVVWLVIAVAGAALDMAAAVKAVSALGKAAKALEAGGDLTDFTKVVKALEEEKKITAEIARAANKAGAARKAFKEASGELSTALGKLYSLPGPFTDPEVYKALVKMAREAIKAKAYDAAKFLDELKLARLQAKLGALTPEELAKVKQAWAEAQALEALEQARYKELLKQIPDATKLDALIAKAGDVGKLEQLLKTFPQAELETVFAQLKDTARLATMLDHLGAETGAGMIRQWMAKGKFDVMNQFMARLSGGVTKELAETAAVGGKSLIIDSNTAIALAMDADPALRATMHAGHKARVAFIKSLPAGTELRAGNITIGEVGSGVINVKGVPLDVARESTEYQKLLSALAKEDVGTAKGFADRGLIADAFFAKVEPGAVPTLLTADQNAVKKLAGLATPKIDVKAAGGFPGIVKTYGTSGFKVTIEGRTLVIIPVP